MRKWHFCFELVEIKTNIRLFTRCICYCSWSQEIETKKADCPTQFSGTKVFKTNFSFFLTFPSMVACYTQSLDWFGHTMFYFLCNICNVHIPNKLQSCENFNVIVPIPNCERTHHRLISVNAWLPKKQHNNKLSKQNGVSSVLVFAVVMLLPRCVCVFFYFAWFLLPFFTTTSILPFVLITYMKIRLWISFYGFQPRPCRVCGNFEIDCTWPT